MIIPSEIILLFFIISFLVYTMPTGLIVFSKTAIGKVTLLILMVLMTLYNQTAGLLIAMLIIFLSEFNYEVNDEIFYEGYEGLDKTNIDKFRKEHCDDKNKLKDENGAPVTDDNLSTVFPKLKFTNNNHCNPCDTSCVFTITDGSEQFETAEELIPKDSKQISVIT
jgi:hypothetical protein